MTRAATFDAPERGMVLFELALQRYAIDIAHLEEIVKVAEVTAVPRLTPMVRGVTVWRGWVVPVVDVRAVLQLPAAAASPQARLLLIKGASDNDRLALWVDRVESVVRLAAAAWRPLAELGDAVVARAAPWVRQAAEVDGQGILLFDAAAFLADWEALLHPGARQDNGT